MAPGTLDETSKPTLGAVKASWQMDRVSIVSDAPTVARLAALVASDIVDLGYGIDFDWLREKGWLAFPVGEDNFYLAGTEVTHRLATALQALGVGRLLAVNLDVRPPDPEACWEFPRSAEGLGELGDKLSIWMFFVTDDKMEFLVLCTKGEFHVVAGPPSFVREAVGGDFELAKAAYIEHAATSWGGSDENIQLDLLERYEAFLASSGYPLSSPRAARRTTRWFVSKRQKDTNQEIERIATERNFGLFSLQSSFDRDRADPMLGEVRVQKENLKYGWYPLKYKFDFDQFDYYVVSQEESPGGQADAR